MTNPFEDPNGTYLALVNDEDQHSTSARIIQILRESMYHRGRDLALRGAISYD